MKPKLFLSHPGRQLSICLAFLVILLLPTPSSGEALLPTVVPPPGVSKIVFGTTLSGQPDCNMIDPLSEPITYTPGATQIAFQIVPVVPGDYNFTASIAPGFGVRTVSRGCAKVSLCSGRICYHSYGYTVNRVDGLPFAPGDYVFTLSFENSAPVNIPFKIPATVPLEIKAQPVDQTIVQGQSAALAVSTSGNGVRYQWYQGTSGDISSPLAGATEASLTTPPLSSNSAYWVRVTDAAGARIDSSSAQITVVTQFGLTGPLTTTVDAPIDIIVTARDSAGSIAPNYRGAVSFSTSDNQALLPDAYVFSTNDNGTHTFSITLKTLGNQTFTVSDATQSGVSGTITLAVNQPPVVIRAFYLPLTHRE